jgi:hypothetical protein
MKELVARQLGAIACFFMFTYRKAMDGSLYCDDGRPDNPLSHLQSEADQHALPSTCLH